MSCEVRGVMRGSYVSLSLTTTTTDRCAGVYAFVCVLVFCSGISFPRVYIHQPIHPPAICSSHPSPTFFHLAGASPPTARTWQGSAGSPGSCRRPCRLHTSRASSHRPRLSRQAVIAEYLVVFKRVGLHVALLLLLLLPLLLLLLLLLLLCRRALVQDGGTVPLFGQNLSHWRWGGGIFQPLQLRIYPKSAGYRTRMEFETIPVNKKIIDVHIFDVWYIHRSCRSVSTYHLHKKHGFASCQGMAGQTRSIFRYIETSKIRYIEPFDSITIYRNFYILIYRNFRYDMQHYKRYRRNTVHLCFYYSNNITS